MTSVNDNSCEMLATLGPTSSLNGENKVVLFFSERPFIGSARILHDCLLMHNQVTEVENRLVVVEKLWKLIHLSFPS